MPRRPTSGSSRLDAASKKAADDLTQAAKKAADDATQAAKALDAAKAEAEAQTKVALAAAEKAAAADATVKQMTETFDGIAKELRANKLLGEPADPAAVAAAVKDAAVRASGPSVSTLLPAGTTAVTGAGLTTAQLVDLTDRIGRSEAAAKAAAETLAKETAALKADYTAQIDGLKKAQADEAKKLGDDFAAETKKLKEGTAAAAKEMSDKFAADVAKLRADQEAAAKKAKDDYEGQVLAAQKKAAEDVARSEAAAAALRADMANVMTPAQALDLYLPLLSEARRPADTAAAAATADKVLATAAPGTEPYAKAQTVKGLARLVKGDDAGAKAAFAAARQDASYGADKPWAKAADEGAAAVTDPVSRFRRPVDPERKDPRAAVRLLDEGIRLYGGRRVRRGREGAGPVRPARRRQPDRLVLPGGRPLAGRQGRRGEGRLPPGGRARGPADGVGRDHRVGPRPDPGVGPRGA